MKKAVLDPKLTRWIRGETNRPELRYHVAHIDIKQHALIPALANIARALEQEHFESKSRGIIFASSIEMVKDLAEEMKCFTHHSAQRLENEINVERWKDGGYQAGGDGGFIHKRWMAATPGLINGIDLDRVDGIVFGEEGMGGLFGGVQGTGRGGQTGHPCMCVFVTSGTFNPKPPTSEDLPCMAHMKRWTTEKNCRRIIPSQVMDGHAISCRSLKEKYSNTEFCDVCLPGTRIMRLITKAIQDAPEPQHITHLNDDDDDVSLGPKIAVIDAVIPSASFYKKPSASDLRRQPFKSSRTSIAPATSSRPWESARPGMAVQMNKVIADDVLHEKYRKRDLLDKYIGLVRGCCYICWFLKGEYDQSGHRPIYDCGLGKEGWGMGWQSFKNRYISALPKYHFCYCCGFPQDVGFKPFQPKFHSDGVGSDNCSIRDFAPLMIFAAKRSPKTWKMVSAEYKLKVDMSDEEFARWVAGYEENTSRFYNGLEMMIWLIEKNRFEYIN